MDTNACKTVREWEHNKAGQEGNAWGCVEGVFLLNEIHSRASPGQAKQLTLIGYWFNEGRGDG